MVEVARKVSYHYRYTSEKNKSKKQGKICLNTFSQVEEVLFLGHLFLKPLPQRRNLNWVTFLASKMILLNWLFPTIFTVFPWFWLRTQKNDKKGLKPRVSSTIMAFFTSLKNVGYDTGFFSIFLLFFLLFFTFL